MRNYNDGKAKSDFYKNRNMDIENQKQFKLNYNAKDEICDDGGTNYVDIAKEVVEVIKKNKDNKILLTTSQIRNLLSLLAEIYKNIVSYDNNVLNDDLKAKIQYFRLKCIYQSGREDTVKDFLTKSNLIDLINQIGDNKKRFLNYYHYMEALVAWHRFNGGKDN